MIDTNLSTRPFYNERLVNALLVLLTILVVIITILNVTTITSLSGKDSVLGVETTRAERQAEAARRNADTIRRRINTADLEHVSQQASEANRLIDRRTFSWTDLLADVEAALPADVRIVTIVPQLQKDGSMRITMTLVGQRAEDVNTFAEKLESRGAFRDMLLQQETVDPEGLRETTLVGNYVGKGGHPGAAK